MTRPLFLDYTGTIVALTLFVCAILWCLALRTVNHALQEEVQYLRWELAEVKTSQANLSRENTKLVNQGLYLPGHEHWPKEGE